MGPILTLTKSTIRPYSIADAPAIAREANNPNVSRFLRNRFPSPYGLSDAEAWLATATAGPPLHDFAICKPDGTFCGGIGLQPLADVEYRTMEIGYWMGEEHWGAGIMTEAVAAVTRWAFREIPELLRLEAGVYEGNEASEKVLGKAGYVFEGARRKAAFKNGKALDIKMFGMLREECMS
jgi:RimJ/RimL family protein N-acetyltransferase